tara:strand:- start:35102 stop:35551 length:450 start_codon:yes stop_codon:yes gene_type:complete
MQNIAKIKIFLFFLFFSLFNTQVYALDIKFESPTIKAPRPGQNISAGFLTITSSTNLQIKSIKSESIKKIEVHSMKMESDGYGGKIMKMRKIKNPQIIANKPFILKPGADHLMFFGMDKSIKKGKELPLKFIFLDEGKLIEKTIIFNVI